MRHWLQQTPGEENPKKRKKYLSPAIGKNYINEMFLFFNILFMDVFTYRLPAKNPINTATEKGDKKSLLLFLSFIFNLSFRGKRLIHSSLAATRPVSE